jgi:hypothetical protein
MASDSGVPCASVGQVDAALLHCTLCDALAVDPRCLPCLHVFCAGCIRELKATELPEMVVRCVKCDGEYKVAGRDPATAFPKHFGVANAVIAAQVAERRMCNNMSKHSGQVAEAWCSNCSKFVCGMCIEVHEGMEALKGHQLTLLAATSGAAPKKEKKKSSGGSGSAAAAVGPAAPRTFATVPRCPEHPDAALDMYCDGKGCPAPGPICMRCAVTSHTDKQQRARAIHIVMPAADVAAAKSAELGASLEATAAVHAKVAILRAGIDAGKAAVASNYETSSAAIAKTFDSLSARLAARRAALEAELTTHRDAKLKCLDLEARSIDMITGHVDAARAATETARVACGDTELVVMHRQLAPRLAALQAECEVELALHRASTVLQFVCGTEAQLLATIGAAGSVHAWGIRAADIRTQLPLPPSWQWGEPMTLTLLIACDRGRDSALVRTAALQHITGSARFLAVGAGAAPQRIEWEASVAVAAAPVGDQLRATLTFPARDRPALADRTARVQVNVACRGEAVAGAPLLFIQSELSFGAGPGDAGAFPRGPPRSVCGPIWSQSDFNPFLVDHSSPKPSRKAPF